MDCYLPEGEYLLRQNMDELQEIASLRKKLSQAQSELDVSRKFANTLKYLLTGGTQMGAIMVGADGSVALGKSLEQLFKLPSGDPTILEGHFEENELKFLDVFPFLKEFSRNYTIRQGGVVPGKFQALDTEYGKAAPNPASGLPTVRALKWLEQHRSADHVFQAGGHNLTLQGKGAPKIITLPSISISFHVREHDADSFVVLINNETSLQHKHTELHSTLRELQKTQAQLIQAEKMASLGTLVAGMAHEINNPVNFVKGGAQNLELHLDELKDFIFTVAEDDVSDFLKQNFTERFDTLKTFLQSIFKGSDRINSIVSDLRTFSNLDRTEAKTIHILDGIRATLRQLQEEYEGHVEFICDFGIDPEMECWVSELNRVFSSLMVNGCQAIMTKQEQQGAEAPGQLTIRTSTQEGHVFIDFQDTGCGMSPAVQENIFEPFFTTRPVGSGTGLGLAIAYRIIEQHGGTINLHSVLNEGTTARVALPIGGLHPVA